VNFLCWNPFFSLNLQNAAKKDCPRCVGCAVDCGVGCCCCCDEDVACCLHLNDNALWTKSNCGNSCICRPIDNDHFERNIGKSPCENDENDDCYDDGDDGDGGDYYEVANAYYFRSF